MGRRLRTNVPVPPTQLVPEWSYVEEFRQLDLAFKRRTTIRDTEFAANLSCQRIPMYG